MTPFVVNATEAAQILSMSRSFFYEQVSISRIPPPIKVGTKSLWSTERLAEWARTEQQRAEGVRNV